MSLSTSAYTDDLRLAHMIADSVDAKTMSFFTSMDFEVETKPDLTPVTEADRQAEELIRGQLSRARGRDAILGEEFGSTGPVRGSGSSTRSTGPRTSSAACLPGPR